MAKNPHQEIFRYFGWAFDISKALALVTERQLDTELIEPRDWAQMVGIDPDHPDNEPTVPLIGVRIDLDHARSLTEDDLERPVLIANIGSSGVLVIDGWHRIAKALLTRYDRLPAVVLDAETTAEVLLPGSAALPD